MSKQRYYRNINNLRICRQVLLSGNFQSEHVAAWEVFKQQYYQKFNTLSLCLPVLLCGNVITELVAAVEIFQTKILLIL